MSRRNLERALLAAAVIQGGINFRFTRLRYTRYCFPPTYDASMFDPDYPELPHPAAATAPEKDTLTVTCVCNPTASSTEGPIESHFSETFPEEHCEEPPKFTAEDCKLHTENFLTKHPWRRANDEYAVHAVQFTPDGRKLVAGCANSSIRVIDTADGAQRLIPRPSRWKLGMPITTIRFMPPKLMWALACNYKGEVFCFNPEREGFETLFKEDQGTYTLDISPDGNELVTGGEDRRIRIYSLQPGAAVGLPTVKLDDCGQGGTETRRSVRVARAIRSYNQQADQPESNIYRLHFPGGRPDQIVDTTCKPYPLTRCYGTSPHEESPEYPEPVGYISDPHYEPPLLEYIPTSPGLNITRGHSMRIMALRFHPEKPSMLFSAGWDNLVKVWDTRLQTGPVLELFGPHVASPDGLDVEDDYLLTASWRAQKSLEIWDIRMISSGYRQDISESGDSTPSVGADGESTGRPVERIPISGELWGISPSKDSGEYLYAARFLPKRAIVAAGSGFYEIRVASRDTSLPIARVPTDSVVQTLDTILDGRYVAAGCTSGTVCLFGLA